MIRFFKKIILEKIEKRKQADKDKLEANKIIDLFTEKNSFEKLKNEIYSLVVKTYYLKKMGMFKDLVDYSVYDIIKNEKELGVLKNIDDDDWKKIIINMIVSSLEVQRDADSNRRVIGNAENQFSIINIPALKRSTFKIVN